MENPREILNKVQLGVMTDGIVRDLNNNDLESKIITIGYGCNEEDFVKLQEEVSKKIKAKKIFITRGGSCICSHTGPEILAISSSN